MCGEHGEAALVAVQTAAVKGRGQSGQLSRTPGTPSSRICEIKTTQLTTADRVIIAGDLELIGDRGILAAPVVTRKLIEKLWEIVEKAKLAQMLKEIRGKENLSQLQLADKANVSQSVISRIETASSRTLPRLDLFNRILHYVGYETSIIAKKKGRTVQVTLAA